MDLLKRMDSGDMILFRTAQGVSRGSTPAIGVYQQFCPARNSIQFSTKGIKLCVPQMPGEVPITFIPPVYAGIKEIHIGRDEILAELARNWPQLSSHRWIGELQNPYSQSFCELAEKYFAKYRQRVNLAKLVAPKVL